MKTKTITDKQWTDAVKILQGRLADSVNLSDNDVKKLKELGGPMTQENAIKAIDKLGWRLTGK